jgi:hypothetical protein
MPMPGIRAQAGAAASWAASVSAVARNSSDMSRSVPEARTIIRPETRALASRWFSSLLAVDITSGPLPTTHWFQSSGMWFKIMANLIVSAG